MAQRFPIFIDLGSVAPLVVGADQGLAAKIRLWKLPLSPDHVRQWPQDRSCKVSDSREHSLSHLPGGQWLQAVYSGPYRLFR